MTRTLHARLRSGAALVSAATLLDCTQTDACFDVIDINASIDVSAKTDPKQPDAMATLEGSALLAYACDAPPEKLTLRGMVLYASDRKTPIADVDVQFEGGSVITSPGTCSGLGHTSKKVSITSSGVPNPMVSGHCGAELWIAGNIERVDCAQGAKSPVAAQVFIECP